MGIEEHHADIIRELELGSGYGSRPGVIAEGYLGSNPVAIADFYRRRGFDVDIQTNPQNIDDQIRRNGMGILTYWTGGTAHTVTVRYIPDGEYPGRFLVYNDNTVPGVRWSTYRDSRNRYIMLDRGAVRSVEDWLAGHVRLNPQETHAFQPWSLITLSDHGF